MEWGDDAFRRAHDEGKPILLALSAVWCHWCHVMDETTYSDPEIIAAINRDFIAIRVDNDARPDINHRYNMGGWPSTAFLTPDGETLTGATYVPPDQMKVLVKEMAEYLRENRETIAKQTGEMRRRRQDVEQPPASIPLPDTMHELVHEIEDAFDPDFGGFGEEPKFPHADALDLLLLSYQREREDWRLAMVRETARRMAEGGLYDREWGGFFRYATMRDWSEPHYEKLLPDQAALLRVYLALYRLTGDDLPLGVIEQTLAYVNRWLSDDSTGAFYGSQDADEEFYRLSASEREKRTAPYVDRTVYANWNARMVSALIDAAITLGRPELAERAGRALDFLFDHMRAPEGGLYHALSLPDGPPTVSGLLVDQIDAAHAALESYGALSRGVDLDRAVALAVALRTHFQDGESGAFFDIWHAAETQGKLAERQTVLEENARAAELFLRLYALTREDEYRTTAAAALAPFALTYRSYGYFGATYGRAAERIHSEPVTITVVGAVDDPATLALRDAALRVMQPFCEVQTLDPARDAARLAALALPHEPAAAAYVCVGYVCSAPLTEAESLGRIVQTMVEAATDHHHHH